MPNLATNPITVDELLEVQAQQQFKGTIEPTERSSDAVKLTPWIPGPGCLCHFAIEVPKSSIESVSMTNDKHVCCGKTLNVVDIRFDDTAVIPIKDLFEQIMAQASMAAERMQRAREFTETLISKSAARIPGLGAEPTLPFPRT